MQTLLRSSGDLNAETTDASQSDYRLAIYSQIKDPHVLSAVFQSVLKVHPTDAIVWARHVPGVLNESFTVRQAQELASAIQAQGFRARAIQRDQVPNLRQAIAVHHARCEMNGLQLIELHGMPEILIPWSAIQMICVGEVPIEISRHFPAGPFSGLSASHHYHPPQIDVPLTPSLKLLITCGQFLPNIRIDHERMNYEYLGSRRVESATSNFQQFIQDLATRATSAQLTGSTRAYMNHEQPESYRFKSPDEFLQYATLEATLAREPLLESDSNPKQ